MFQTLLSFVIGLASGVLLTLLILNLRERRRIKKLQHSKAGSFAPEMEELTTWAPDVAWDTESSPESTLAETAAIALQADTESRAYQEYHTTIALETSRTISPDALGLAEQTPDNAHGIELEVETIEFALAAPSATGLTELNIEAESAELATADSRSETSASIQVPLDETQAVPESATEQEDLQAETALSALQESEQIDELATGLSTDLADELAAELAVQVGAELAAQAAAEEQEMQAAEALRLASFEAAKLEQEKQEQAIRQAQALEQQRAAQEAEQLEAERLEAEQQEAAQLEAARLEAARLEADRLEAEQQEAAQLEAAQLEAARLEADQLETARLEAEWQALQAERQSQLALEREQQQEALALQQKQQEQQEQQAQATTAPATLKIVKDPADTIILVADDSKVVRVKTSRVLAKHTYQVNLAEDGLDAANQIAFALPDVLVTDVEMPGMDGFALTLHLRNNPATAHLPIIMISGASDELADKAKQAGVNVLLGKPYADEELIGHIQRLVQDAPV